MSRFISEADIAEKKKKLKEAWDATRGEGDPEEPPEEPPPDNRPLYHRLEEQRLKKQEDYESAHKLKNMVRGLENDEVEFLDLVDRTKMEQERKVKEQEDLALSEFRKRRVEMELEQTAKLTAQPPSNNKKIVKDSQKLLLSGAIKRKSSNSETPAKKIKTDGETDNSINTPKVLQNGTSSPSNPPTTKNISPAKDSSNSPPKPLCAFGNNMQVAGILPGMGHYSDSSDSSNDSNSESEVNDSDSEPCDIFGRVPQTHCDDGCH